MCASDIYVQAGVLAIESYDNRLQTSVNIHMTSGGTFSLRQVEGWGNLGGNQTVGSLQGAGGTVTNAPSSPYYTLTVNQTGGTYTYSGLISGNMNLVKSGAGTWVLTGTANAYTGGTTLATGKLILANASGSALGTGSLILNGGTLASGSGATSGFMTGNVTGTTTAAYMISPGDSTASGLLTIGTGTSGQLNLTSSATLDFSNIFGTTAGTNMDQIKVNGAVNFIGGGVANFIVPTGLPVDTSYTLIYATAAGNFSDAGASEFAFLGGAPSGYSLSWDNTNYDLNLTVLPEPATLSLLALGGLLAWRRRR